MARDQVGSLEHILNPDPGSNGAYGTVEADSGRARVRLPPTILAARDDDSRGERERASRHVVWHQ